jgi:Tfp pilus assembly protein PilO
MNKLDINLREAFRNLRLSALEWVALVATILFVGVVTFYFLNSAQPLRSKLSDLRTREKKLQDQMVSDTTKKKSLEEQRANREKILDSLESFEVRLHGRKVGITAIIDEVNQLAKANRVKAGDIAFRTDAPAPLPGDAQPGANPGTTPTPAAITQRDKLPNVYEGLGIDTTVEGDYHDLRRFMAALERSRNFVIVNAIALQSIDETQRSKSSIGNLGASGIANPGPSSSIMPPAAPIAGEAPGVGQAPVAPTKIVVALKIEMETRFAREARPELTAKPLPANAPAPRP